MAGLEGSPHSQDQRTNLAIQTPSHEIKPDGTIFPVDIQRGSGEANGTMTNSLNPILDAVRESFEGLVIQVTGDMRAKQECDVPVSLHYEVKQKVIERMPDGGLVQVANILSCREWQTEPFNANYLQAELTAIQSKHLIVERYFIGTVDEFTDKEVMENLEQHEEAGVRVRRVYVTPDIAQQPDFKRDIGYHQTVPPCLTEGIREAGFMWKGFVATSASHRIDAERIIRILQRHSPRYHGRQGGTDRMRVVGRSVEGWTRFWNEQSGCSDGNSHNPMLEMNLEKIIRDVLRVRPASAEPFNIIDAGCGDGKNLVFCVDLCNKLAAEFPSIQFEITGADICRHAVDLCRRKLDRMSKVQNVDARVLQSDIRHDEVPSPHPDVRRFARQVCADFWYLHISIDVPAVTGRVDVLFMSDTFIHIYPTELEYALAEWRRVLRKRGRLLFNVNRQDDDVFADCRAAVEKGEHGCEEVDEYMPSWWFRDTFYRYYSEKNLRQMLTDANFAINSIKDEDRQEKSHGPYRQRDHWHRNRVIDAFAKD